MTDFFGRTNLKICYYAFIEDLPISCNFGRDFTFWELLRDTLSLFEKTQRVFDFPKESHSLSN